MRYRIRDRSGDDDDAYTAAMADMLAGLVFIFMLVAMTFALFSREVQQQTRLAPLKRIHSERLTRLAAELSKQGFCAEPVESEGLVRIRSTGLFNADAFGLSAQADCVIDLLDESLMRWFADNLGNSTTTSDNTLDYSQFIFRLHSVNSRFVDAMLLTNYRALTLHAHLIKRNTRYFAMHNASNQSFFSFIGFGESRLPIGFCEEAAGECDAIDLVLIPTVPLAD